MITVSSRPQEFYFIGGRINYPGQKVFQPGITLLQAILAAGGTPKQDNRVEISREGADGRLVTMNYTVKQIKSAAIQDQTSGWRPHRSQPLGRGASLECADLSALWYQSGAKAPHSKLVQFY